MNRKKFVLSAGTHDDDYTEDGVVKGYEKFVITDVIGTDPTGA